MSNLNGWHRGERLARQKLGFDNIPSIATLFNSISGDLPDQHIQFHTTRLSFLPVTTLDDDGRPWGTILAASGRLGFIRYPKYNTLVVNAELWDGDPLLRTISRQGKPLEGKSSRLVAGIGVELSTRRRNKFAGTINQMHLKGKLLTMEIEVNEALGNCPKYIVLRSLEPALRRNTRIKFQRTRLTDGERLPKEAIALIQESDTVFLGTVYSASEEEAKMYPSHVGMNHRGGRPGFIRVKPSDGRTVVLPDFSGNRFMTSLGNIEATPSASMTFISFRTGDVLYLTGIARNLYGEEAGHVMPFQNTLTELFVTGYILVKDAFPLRESPTFTIGQSPYSPPIKLLAEESAAQTLFSTNDSPIAQLVGISMHDAEIATFRWESSVPLSWKPGQAIILDFSTLLGSRRYQHMSEANPNLVNDDFIRTWTISNFPKEGSTSTAFTLTMRRKINGIVTGALFRIANGLTDPDRREVNDLERLELKVKIVGVSGDFHLTNLEPPLVGGEVVNPSREMARNLVWVAGGIGVTPFLSMLNSLVRTPLKHTITLILSTREPGVILDLVDSARKDLPSSVSLALYLFSAAQVPQSARVISVSSERLGPPFFNTNRDMFHVGNPEIYLCGPPLFEEAVLEGLKSIDVQPSTIHRETFTY